MSVWKGLTAIICSHLNREYGNKRKEYISYMLNSLKKGTMLPGKVVISYTSKIGPLEISEEYPFTVQIINRGLKMAQMCQLLINIYEEEVGTYILLLDDDDLCSPNLVQRNYENWIKNNEPSLFYFQSGTTEGFGDERDHTATEFNNDWSFRDALGLFKVDYGGSCCSLKVLKFYFKTIIWRCYNINLSASDVLLYRLGSIEVIDMTIDGDYYSENPSVIDMVPDKKITKVKISEMLYFRRRWRSTKERLGCKYTVPEFIEKLKTEAARKKELYLEYKKLTDF